MIFYSTSFCMRTSTTLMGVTKTVVFFIIVLRYICTISDKEVLEKCQECVRAIREAKEAQAARANQNATILLEELDAERSREESRRLAAARRRHRKKKKKMEKKVIHLISFKIIFMYRFQTRIAKCLQIENG